MEDVSDDASVQRALLTTPMNVGAEQLKDNITNKQNKDRRMTMKQRYIDIHKSVGRTTEGDEPDQTVQGRPSSAGSGSGVTEDEETVFGQ